jgi:hypothetical protein
MGFMTQQSHICREIVCTAASFLVLAAFFLSGCAGSQTATPSPSPPAFPTAPTQAPAMQNTPTAVVAQSAIPLASPTGELTITLSATPTVVTATPTPTDAPVPQLAFQTLAVAPIDRGLLFDSWSPDGQWVAYWLVDSEAGAEHPVFVNATDSRRCEHKEVIGEGWDGRVTWQEDGKVTVVVNQEGKAMSGSVCGTFAPGENHTLPDRHTTVDISPDGRYRAETRLVRSEGEGGQYKSLTITDVATGQTIFALSYLTSIYYSSAGQGWLNEELYLVGVAIDQGVLYVSVPDGRIGHVLPDFFGLDASDEEYVSRLDLRTDPAAGVYHILIQIYQSSPTSPLLLYHGELDQVEQLAFYFAWPWYNSSSFTPDGQWLLLGNPVEAGTPGPDADYWLRLVDPPGSAAIHVVHETKFEGVSDQARAMAEIWADAALGQWAFCGLSRPAQQVAFCRDNWVRIFALPEGTLLAQPSAAPYDVTAVWWSPDGSWLVAGGFDQKAGKQALFLIEAPPVTPACANDGPVLFTVPVGPDGVQYGAEQTGPMALAVAGDGTFWIADTQGNRLLHYDSQGVQLNRIDLNGHGIGVADVESVGSDVLALMVGYGEQVLRFNADGNLLATYDIPGGLGPEGGLTGLAVGDHGQVLLEFEMGAQVAQLVDAQGALEPSPLPGYTYDGQLYKAELAGWQTSRGTIVAGSARIEVTVPDTLAGLRILGFGPAGNLYVVVDEMVSTPSVVVDEIVRLYDPAGDLLGVARVPLAEGYTFAQNGLAVGPDGCVYALLTHPDRVEVVRLHFSTDP